MIKNPTHLLLNRNSKAILSAIFLLIAASAINIQLLDVPSNPANINIYTYYITSWVFVLISLSLLLYLSLSGKLSSLLFLIALCLCLGSVSSISLLWGLPFSSFDPWVHLKLVRFGIFSFEQNPYPSLHILVEMCSRISTIEYVQIFSHGIIAVGIIGLISTYSILKQQHTKDKSQVITILSLPLWTLSFSLKPFTLVLPLLALTLFYILLKDRRRTILFLLFVIAGLLLHPQYILLIFVLALSFTLIISITDFWDFRLFINEDYTASLKSHFAIIILCPILVYGYLAYVSGMAGDLFLTLVQLIGLSPEGSPSGPSKQSKIQKLLSNPSKILEAVARLSYIISLSFLAFQSQLKSLYNRNIRILESGVVLNCVILTLIFIFADLVLKNTVLTLNRLIAFILPLYLIFLIGRELKPQSRFTIVLSLLVLTSGIVMVYPSPLTGTISISPNQQQDSSTSWIAEYHGNNSVIGTSTTFFVLTAKYGQAFGYKLTEYTNLPPTEIAQRRSAEYSWEVETEVSSLYVVDSPERATARADSNRNSTQSLDTFSNSRNKVYSTEGVNIYSS